MAWERELNVLEEAIRRLNVEYDAFLYSPAARPPSVQSRKHIEQMIRQLSAESPESAADRFRFQMLQGRFSSLGERWERLQLEKEAGRRPGLYGHFASDGSAPGSRPDRVSAGAANAGTPAPVQEERRDGDAERQLYQRYLAARKAKGENMEGYGFERFAESLDRQRKQLTERMGTSDIVFDVAERDGKVKLIARRGAPLGPDAGAPK